MLYLDTETCGLHGPIVLIQYAEDDGPIILYHVWEHSIDETLKLYDWIMSQVICGFNLAFDWFHICQQYTVLLLLKNKYGGDAKPDIEQYANYEADGRNGPCCKPLGALDLMLVARKGAYQSTMDRKPIRIKKVPTELSEPLINLLDASIKIPEIYFSRKKEKTKSHWRIDPVDKDFVNLELKFAPSNQLKALAKEIFKYDPIKYSDIEINKKLQPIDAGWAPFATALSSKEKKWRAKIKKHSQWVEGYAWPGVIEYHIRHWKTNERAQQYASDDVLLLRKLYDYFNHPEPNDKDSILATIVGAVRWRGYALNLDGIRDLRRRAVLKAQSAPKDPSRVLALIKPYLSQSELEKLKDEKTGRISTKKVLLEDMSKWKKPCSACIGQVSVMAMLNKEEQVTDCKICGGSGELNELHPVATPAKECLEARQAYSEITMWDKLIQAGRLHASFSVIGAFSARMAGTDGLNTQGLSHAKYVRQQFLLAFGELEGNGGDFSSFEVSIADAICNDEKLRKALSTCEKCKGIWPQEVFAHQMECPHCGQTDNEGKPCRQKFHGIFGIALTGGKMSYDQILATKGTLDDWYDKGKRGGFSQFYGGNWNTLVIRLGISEEVARAAEEYFQTDYKGVGKWREKIKDDFCSMRQEGGLGTKVTWHEPKEYVESLTGHRRYFTLENRLAKSLFTLSTKLPNNWKELSKIVQRSVHRGPQKIAGAVMSALLAAAFNIQSSVMRAAANHIIQSTGAELTKLLQVRLWNLQPYGVNKWHIQPMNIHDEIMAPCLPELKPEVKKIVNQFVIEYSKLIPLLAIDWSYNMKTWAEK